MKKEETSSEGLYKGVALVIDDLWPEFDAWIHQQVLGYGDAKSTIKEWYRYLIQSEQTDSTGPQ